MKVAILGAGESGVGAAILAQSLKYEIWVSDFGSIKEPFLSTLKDKGIPYEEGGHTLEKFFESDLIIKSPGIPEKASVIQELRSWNKEIVSEIEFAYRHSEAQIIAITGSNGKTTTTSLIHHLLEKGGIKAELAGNIGYSFARQLVESPSDCYVIEVSSFQLDEVRDFCPNIALLLNITPDHLDRYDYSMEAYAKAKLKIGARQKKGQSFIFNADDEYINRLKRQNSLVNQLPFGKTEREGLSAWIEGDRLCWDNGWSIEAGETQLLGKHNQLNMLAAVLAAQKAGINEEAAYEGLKSFQAIPHRLETVGHIEGVRYINDSKATNVDSVYYALGAVKGRLLWIAGGVDKGNDYQILQDLVHEKVKMIIVLGAGLEKFQNEFDAHTLHADSMKKALELARNYAENEETVLLSPACASFDLFQNYEDRGNQFKQIILQWMENKE